MTVRAWQAGDRVAMQRVDEARWLVIPADQAREKLGITEATPGWTFVEVVADWCDTPDTPAPQPPQDA
jgi:hypothetical protein